MIKHKLAVFALPAFALSVAFAATPLMAADSVRLSTPVAGVVAEVFVQPGARVKKGEKLLALDNTRYQAGLAQAEAARTRLKLEAEEADKDLKRTEELYARGVGSTTELDAAKLRHVRATTALQEADARRQVAQKNLDDTVLRAPFDGVIKSREAEPGMVVSVDCTPPVLIVLGKPR